VPDPATRPNRAGVGIHFLTVVRLSSDKEGFVERTTVVLEGLE